jgi:hypothetical protein
VGHPGRESPVGSDLLPVFTAIVGLCDVVVQVGADMEADATPHFRPVGRCIPVFAVFVDALHPSIPPLQGLVSITVVHGASATAQFDQHAKKNGML